MTTGFLHPGSRMFAGFDKTSGESGGCSLNDKLEIDMPFRLEQAGLSGGMTAPDGSRASARCIEALIGAPGR